MTQPHGERPEWAPKDGGDGFASFVSKSRGGESASVTRKITRKKLTVDEYVEGIQQGSRTILARAITVIESNSAKHIDLGQEILQAILPKTGNSIRIGITGVPGAGKSTFIEALGQHLTAKGHKVAVLAVDPTSSVSGGSILGDKTRMEKLVRDDNAFIRPSPSGGTLGGIARKTRETTLLCEAAGYDVMLIETVGVGQSEGAVRNMTDFFLLLQIPGAGDELQGMKRGVMELADLFLINKAEEPNRQKAHIARGEIARVIPFLSPATEGWTPEARLCSALTGEGIAEAWEIVQKFREETQRSGVFKERRQQQNLTWMESLVTEALEKELKSHPKVQELRPALREQVARGETPPLAAAQQLLNAFLGREP